MQDVIVPDSQSHEVLALEIGIAFGVTARLRMLAAVGLDDQPGLEANEIGNVMIYWHLALELEALRGRKRFQDLSGAKS